MEPKTLRAFENAIGRIEEDIHFLCELMAKVDEDILEEAKRGWLGYAVGALSIDTNFAVLQSLAPTVRSTREAIESKLAKNK